MTVRGSWVVISGVRSRVTLVITSIRGLVCVCSAIVKERTQQNSIGKLYIGLNSNDNKESSKIVLVISI